MSTVFEFAILIYSVFVTLLLLWFKSKADKSDRLVIDLRDSEEARHVENEKNYKSNQSWAQETILLKKQVIDLSDSLRDCHNRLRKGGIQQTDLISNTNIASEDK